MKIQGEPFTLLHIYAPNTEHEQVIFILNINKILNCNDISASDSIIIGGDWNVVRDQHFDQSGGIINIKHNTLDQLYQLMNNFELNDMENKKSKSKALHLATNQSTHSVPSRFRAHFRQSL